MTFEHDKRMAAVIRELRMAREMTQEQLAAQLQLRGLDISRNNLANLESGRRHIYTYEIKAFKEIFGVSYDDLFV